MTMAFKMAYGHSGPKTQYSAYAPRGSERISISEGKLLFFMFPFSVRLGTIFLIPAQYFTDRPTSRVNMTYSPGWLHTADALDIQ